MIHHPAWFCQGACASWQKPTKPVSQAASSSNSFTWGLQNSPHSLGLITRMLYCHYARLLSCGMKLNAGHTICWTWRLQTAREERQVCGVVWVWVETEAFTVELQTNVRGPRPRIVINSSVISVFITQTEIDIQGSYFSGFLCHFSNISKPDFDWFIVLFIKDGSSMQCIRTNRVPPFQPLSVQGLFRYIMTFLQLF